MSMSSAENVAADASADRKVVLGRIRSAVGLAGWVKVDSFTDPADNILSYPVWQLRTSTGWRALRLQHSRRTGQGLQVQFEGIAERNAAQLLRNTEVAVSRHELPPPAEGEYYWDDLLGLDAVTPVGETLGRLDHYLDSPAHPYMVLRGMDARGGKFENLVPMIKGRVLSVDFGQRRMVLDWTLDWAE